MSGSMRLLLFCFCLLLHGLLLAQSYTTYPDLLTLNAYNGALINPGHVTEEGRSDLFAAYKFRTGALKDVTSSFFTAERTFRKENESAHVGRVSLANEKEGPYISKPRGYLNYAYQLPLRESLSLYAGISLGIAGSYYSVPGSSGNQAATLPDGNVGVGIKNERFNFGLACLQMLNSSAQPYNATLILGRYYHAHVSYQLPLGIDWNLKSQLLWRHLPQTEDQGYGLLSLSYANMADVGAVYLLDKGISFFVAFQPLYKEDRLLFSFTYNSALSTNAPAWQNSMEVTVGFRIQ